MMESPPQKKLTVWEVTSLLSQVGFLIALPIAGGALFGFIVDKKLDSAPFLTLVFLLLGIGLGFWAVLKRLKSL